MNKWLRTEDAWAVILGLMIVMLGMGNLLGVDSLGWAVTTKEWVDPTKAIQPASDNYAKLTGIGSLALTYLFSLMWLGLGAWAIGLHLRRFLLGFTVIFALGYLAWVLGHYGPIAATPDKMAKLGVTRSLGMTGEAGYIIALMFGLLIGNFARPFATWLREAARPEWFIKMAIVILGAGLGVKAAQASGFASSILFRGFAAIIEAYLIYWALVYLIARRVFGFSREWAAPLASGISICGVSAAITTGAAIRARPVVPVMVSSLVVIFAVIEMVLLPLAARYFLADQPMVAAAWMGLAVKTDGAAISSGALTESYIQAEAARMGIQYEPGWMLLTTTTVKVFIDLFIGVWAVVLAVFWTYAIDRKPGAKVPVGDIWTRFPKFVLAYVIAFGVMLTIGLMRPDTIDDLKLGTGASDGFRRLFFVMTFFSIGLASDFRQLWAEGIGRLALVYVLCLFGFIIWIGLLISWLFFQGVLPPIIPLK